MNFSDLGLSPKVVCAVADAGYVDPTPIQVKTIPLVLQRHDVCGIAQTGTGKTASFVLPMLTILEKGRARARMPRTLILEPTRELASQVADNFQKYGKNYNLNVALLIGGIPFEAQNKKLERGADVLICTPGRILDHFNRGKLLMNNIEILVIDEADRMLDMGFIPDIQSITSLIPFTRQTLLFSATMTEELQKVSEKFLQNPKRIEVNTPYSTAETIEHCFVATYPQYSKKFGLVQKLIREQDEIKNAIIFCNQKKDVASLCCALEKQGFSVCAIHGNMDQRSRIKILDSFKEGTIQLMVASDLAARGLDIPDVGHVFNFDVPNRPENYIHRIGRTGRAGRSGKAFTLVTSEDVKYIDAIEKLIEKKISWLDGDLSTLQPSEKLNETQRSNTTKNKNIQNTSPKLSHKKKKYSSQTSRVPSKEEVVISKSYQDTQEHDISAVGFKGNVPAFMLPREKKI
ncbi:RNA helicase [Candidatus Liberibacter solanacearum]|uniref:DEAD-box ATP-dependent RNA helicase RhpA n=1 Tax=Candidatus Liberibacter solanacearum TaxID=556287 RepID=A0A094Z371_9HYPH|nr:DEAD/DEAH box helicase [Candidatus Liberibacter solanacearum]KGB27404.1 RNA helicase [Candidatus Liberibacter solanacearum]KJZ81124.1 RNA helicase [Candidatus Liberibacter solanacearum]KJZ82333.1 ATP-dependent RNA helicase [Candidatus Liberibacter solanacearum]KQC49269.1 RNA helicase [Candidatus Liberibacter solanacearum]